MDSVNESEEWSQTAFQDCLLRDVWCLTSDLCNLIFHLGLAHYSAVFLLCSSLTSSSILVIFLSKSYLMLKHFETILEESVQLLEQVIAKLIMRIRYY